MWAAHIIKLCYYNFWAFKYNEMLMFCLFIILESQLYSSLLRNELLRDDIDSLTVITYTFTSIISHSSGQF